MFSELLLQYSLSMD